MSTGTVSIHGDGGIVYLKPDHSSFRNYFKLEFGFFGQIRIRGFDRIRIVQNVMILSDLDPDSARLKLILFIGNLYFIGYFGFYK